MSSTTTKRSLARPSFNTASSPNLSASYNSNSSLQKSIHKNIRPLALARKSSLNALTSNSLATIPDASAGYGLSTVLDEDSPSSKRMQPLTPSRGARGDGLDVGDIVDVPGDMHGTVMFIGGIPGKKGTFVGVELSGEYASRGKNNGDVDG